MIAKTLAALCRGLLLALAAGPAAAQDDVSAEVREALETCVTCHGEAGASTNSAFPILAGQEFYYLYVQLKDFKARRRDSEVMSPLAEAYDRDLLRALAEYFSRQTWPGIGYRADDAAVAAGRRAINAGQCVACHLGGFEGNSRVPRLAGQYPEYLEKTMLDFKTKKRANSPAKSSLMASFDKADIVAMAKYLGGL